MVIDCLYGLLWLSKPPQRHTKYIRDKDKALTNEINEQVYILLDLNHRQACIARQGIRLTMKI